MDDRLIQELQNELPAVFAGHEVDRLTGMAIRWSTFRNIKYSDDCPSNLFIKLGRKTLVRREVFLVWLQKHLSEVESVA